MKILLVSIICLVLGVLLTTTTLLNKSNNVSSLGSSNSSLTDENKPDFLLCPAVVRDITEYSRGWPYSVLRVTAYGSSEDIGITGCEREDNYEFYPVSFLANTLVYSSITVVLYLIMKEFKNKGVKDGK